MTVSFANTRGVQFLTDCSSGCMHELKITTHEPECKASTANLEQSCCQATAVMPIQELMDEADPRQPYHHPYHTPSPFPPLSTSHKTVHCNQDACLMITGDGGPKGQRGPALPNQPPLLAPATQCLPGQLTKFPSLYATCTCACAFAYCNTMAACVYLSLQGWIPFFIAMSCLLPFLWQSFTALQV